MFGFKLVKKMLFLQSFYIRSLLSGVNDNPPLKTSLSSNYEVLLSIQAFYRIIFLTSMFIKNVHSRTEFII